MDVGLLEKGGFSGEGGLIDSKGWLRGWRLIDLDKMVLHHQVYDIRTV